MQSSVLLMVIQPFLHGRARIQAQVVRLQGTLEVGRWPRSSPVGKTLKVDELETQMCRLQHWVPSPQGSLNTASLELSMSTPAKSPRSESLQAPATAGLQEREFLWDDEVEVTSPRYCSDNTSCSFSRFLHFLRGGCEWNCYRTGFHFAIVVILWKIQLPI